MKIHFEDTHLVVAEKPAGLLSVPGRGEDKQDCMITRLQVFRPEALVIHRLDQVTSGLMLFAKSLEVQRALSEKFANREIDKTYIALVEGMPATDSGIIQLPLICDWPNRPRQIVDFEIGKPAVTKWQVLARNGRTTRLELKPQTGRTHQLRVHMQSMGHPIAGDVLYGAEPCERVYLHASALSFEHPSTGASVQFISAPSF